MLLCLDTQTISVPTNNDTITRGDLSDIPPCSTTTEDYMRSANLFVCGSLLSGTVRPRRLSNVANNINVCKQGSGSMACTPRQIEIHYAQSQFGNDLQSHIGKAVVLGKPCFS